MTKETRLQLSVHPLAEGKSGHQVARSVRLDACNTMGLPCVAENYFEVRTLADLRTFAANASELPWMLGGGSNVLLPPKLTQPVCRMMIRGIDIEEDAQDVYITVGAGELWHSLVMYTVQRGWWGLENLALIPGTVGAAPIQNIGAYGVELADVLCEVYWFDWARAELVMKPNEDCEFGYRDSWFKKMPYQSGCVVAVRLKLSKTPRPVLSYQPLDKLANTPGLAPQQIAQEVMAIRRAKLPDPEKIHNAGSFFKNPVIDEHQYQELRTRWPNLVAYPMADGRYKLAAGWLIDRLGMRGIRHGAVGTHPQQALVIVNYGGATLSEVMAFAHWIRQRVYAETGVTLTPEVRTLEPWPWN